MKKEKVVVKIKLPNKEEIKKTIFVSLNKNQTILKEGEAEVNLTVRARSL